MGGKFPKIPKIPEGGNRRGAAVTSRPRPGEILGQKMIKNTNFSSFSRGDPEVLLMGWEKGKKYPKIPRFGQNSRVKDRHYLKKEKKNPIFSLFFTQTRRGFNHREPGWNNNGNNDSGNNDHKNKNKNKSV